MDLPEANDLPVGIMALVAQQEREAISTRTKEALATAQGAAACGWATPQQMMAALYRWSPSRQAAPLSARRWRSF